MQRCSESIASLAAALAKAQAELVNPEKTLVGTIHPDSAGGSERSFRYASLASGLDIVRKTLGEHEIATVQTTAIDHGAGIVNLTTVLAHSSGQWIASDWPVCAVGETTSPHRMGAALTYARRYALFTLVGIAGEDDLDAPDLQGPSSDRGTAPSHSTVGRLNGGSTRSEERGRVRRGNVPCPAAKPELGPEDSAALRDRLRREIAALSSSDDAAIWAHRSLAAKNALTADDAQQVEAAFQVKLTGFSATDEFAAERDASREHEPNPSVPEHKRQPHTAGKGRPKTRADAKRPRVRGVDKSVLPHPEPRRIRDRDHVRYVARKPCLICGRQPSDSHHLRFAQSRALGRKVSDEFTVPLCRGHHRELHRQTDEIAWWKNAGIDPTVAARALWLESHPLPETPNSVGGKGPSSDAASGADRRTAKDDRSAGKRGSADETKPIPATDPL